MKRIPITSIAFVLSLVLAGCGKVEVASEAQNAMLPLAVGNQWVYVDSFFTTTTLPASDTLVTEITYNVDRKRWIDRFVDHGKPTKSMERLQGWEISNNVSDINATMIWLNDTLYSTGFSRLFFPLGYLACTHIQGDLVKHAPYLSTTGYTGLHPAMFASPVVGDSSAYYPNFHDLPDCMSALGSGNNQNLAFGIKFWPLVATATPVMVTTPAGTFSCIDFGSQYWAEGVGMVQSRQQGDASFVDDNQMPQTGTIVWKRTLKSYHLN